MKKKVTSDVIDFFNQKFVINVCFGYLIPFGYSIRLPK